jgi:Tol biopolymer transport system component
VALLVEESPEESDIWVLELERNLLTRFTQGPGPHADPVWSPDGRFLAYSTSTDGPWNIYRKPFPAGGDPQPVVEGPEPFKNPLDWSPDGRHLLYDGLGEGTEMDLLVVPADGSAPPRFFVREGTNQREGRFSPDGRWVVYSSFETGGQEVYVTSFPDATRKHRISVDGGLAPRWSADGSRIRFATPRREQMEVTFQADPEVRTGIPRRRFEFPRNIRRGTVAPDGRVLIVRPATEDRRVSATVILNWMEGLE